VRHCFILGILQRSGTNYLSRLLSLHPHCRRPVRIWEDFLLHESELLKDYASRVFGHWNPKWESEKAGATREAMLRQLGDALLRFLGPQTGSELLLTKTPSVRGLENFFLLFPDSLPVIIVRDGRAVVESGAKSFGWDYEAAMRKWAEAARTIVRFVEENRAAGKRVCVVKYEQLVADQKAELLKVLGFLALDPSLYDFGAARALGVVGSSDMMEKEGALHWKTQEKSADFNSLERFKDWSAERHARFNRIAGQYMSALGYVCA
jgi:hypothetical protein